MEQGRLTGVLETRNIVKTETGAEAHSMDGTIKKLDVENLVSMNMWGLTPDFMEILEKGFAEFLSGMEADDLKKEYLLPELIDRLLKADTIRVDVLETKDNWFGVTYQEDKEIVKKAFTDLTAQGVYPNGLY